MFKTGKIIRSVFIVLIFLSILQQYHCKGATELFRDFWNLLSVDVPNLGDIPGSVKCRDCPRVYIPVCGDDNATYTNECLMRCANDNKQKNPRVKMVRTGPCQIFPDN